MTSNIRTSISAATLLAFIPLAGWALDFLYVEDTLEYARLVSVEADVGVRQGQLILEHDCRSCPQQISFNRDTRLDTPFGTDRPLQEITEWQGHPVMVHYSLPTPVATEIVVFRLNAEINDVEPGPASAEE